MMMTKVTRLVRAGAVEKSEQSGVGSNRAGVEGSTMTVGSSMVEVLPVTERGLVGRGMTVGSSYIQHMSLLES